MVAQEIIETASQTLATVAADPVKIVLFGSHARGDAGPDSDFDFLVVEREPKDRHAEMVRLGRALRPLGVPFDVLVVSENYAEDWGNVEGSMVHAALTEGRVLHRSGFKCSCRHRRSFLASQSQYSENGEGGIRTPDGV
jgi:uncharacterized protein